MISISTSINNWLVSSKDFELYLWWCVRGRYSVSSLWTILLLPAELNCVFVSLGLFSSQYAALLQGELSMTLFIASATNIHRPRRRWGWIIDGHQIFTHACYLWLVVCVSWEICGEIATTGDIFYFSWASHYSELFYRWLAHKLAHWAKTLWTIFTGWWWLDRRVARRGGVITQYLLWLLTRTTYIFSPAFLKSSLKWSEGATIVLHRHDRGVASNLLTMSTKQNWNYSLYRIYPSL